MKDYDYNSYSYSDGHKLTRHAQKIIYPNNTKNRNKMFDTKQLER